MEAVGRQAVCICYVCPRNGRAGRARPAAFCASCAIYLESLRAHSVAAVPVGLLRQLQAVGFAIVSSDMSVASRRFLATCLIENSYVRSIFVTP